MRWCDLRSQYSQQEWNTDLEQQARLYLQQLEIAYFRVEELTVDYPMNWDSLLKQHDMNAEDYGEFVDTWYEQGRHNYETRQCIRKRGDHSVDHVPCMQHRHVSKRYFYRY